MWDLSPYLITATSLKSYGKIESLTSVKSKHLNRLTQFVRIEYVDQMNACSKFGGNPLTGTSGQHYIHCVREKSKPLYTLSYGKQCKIVTTFWTNNATSNCKQITKFNI